MSNQVPTPPAPAEVCERLRTHISFMDAIGPLDSIGYVIAANMRAALLLIEQGEKERERDGLKTSGMDADTCIEIEELKKFKARLEWLGNPANKFAYSIEKDGEVKVGTRWDFQRFKTLSAAIDHFRGINSAHAASADAHARKEATP